LTKKGGVSAISRLT